MTSKIYLLIYLLKTQKLMIVSFMSIYIGPHCFQETPKSYY